MSQSVETVSLDDLLSGEPDRNTFESLRKVIHASRASYRMAEKRAGELKQSLEEKGKNDSSAQTLGMLLTAMGLYKGAFDVLSTLKPSADIRYFAGLALVRLGRYEEAIKMLSGGPAGDRDARMLLAETYIITGQSDEADKVMKEMDLNTEETADGCYLLGRLAEAAGEYERAIELFQKAAQLNPEHLSALFRLA